MTDKQTPVRIEDLHSAIVAGLGAIGQMVCACAHQARTFAQMVRAEEKFIRDSDKPNDLNVCQAIRDQRTRDLWATLREVDAIMQRLGDADEEPDDLDVDATSPVFDRIRNLLAERTGAIELPTHEMGEPIA